MKWATLGLILLGIAGAVCAAVLVAVYRAGPDPSGEEAQTREVDVLVAAMDLPDMAMLDIAAVETRKIPLSQRPKDAFATATPVIGKVLRVPLLKGQVLTQEHFATSGTGVHLAATLPEGYRAVTVPLDQSGSIEGLLYPGGVVDVMASFRLMGRNALGESISTVLLERVPVLAVEDRTVVGAEEKSDSNSASRGGRRFVTLRVTPEQAAQLQLASEHGSVSLAMRNPLDRETAEPTRVFLSSLSQQGQSWVELPPPTAGLAQLLPPANESDATEIEQPDVLPENTLPDDNQNGESEDDQPPQPMWPVVVIRGATQQTQMLPLKETEHE